MYLGIRWPSADRCDPMCLSSPDLHGSVPQPLSWGLYGLMSQIPGSRGPSWHSYWRLLLPVKPNIPALEQPMAVEPKLKPKPVSIMFAN